ncbi:hypothetical protein [Candidatus Uabimicrobium amorphum]|uniref:Class I SAM-dependent methyltransferase n=1 Tax=Uabimicrobium amorphum TaxID=2596890 RepID=A0A5S9IP61_UABAM|nr:hypothetical protein [Candidatus Uabimicrobium amorphum]BBM85518.1 hypothetical protein UABAM_03887 [Candidatus Uabimicrobium amorphum]
MGRLHLFEFNDQDWLPQSMRITLMELLIGTYSLLKIFQPVFPKVHQFIEETNTQRLQLLCAGGGGPVIDFASYLEQKTSNKIQITLSDKFPNIERYKKLQREGNVSIDYNNTSVDVFDLPKEMEGTRVVINAVHHFKPPQVEKILHDAVTDNANIVFMEPVQRTPRCFVNILFALPIFLYLGIFGIRPFRLRRFFWTVLFPVVTIITVFDGLISTLRAYKPKEWQHMAEKIDPQQHYHWQIGIASTPLTKVTYLMGTPKTPKS